MRRGRPHILALPSHRSSGALLLLSVLLTMVLMTLAYTLTYDMRIGLKMTSHGGRQAKARGIARAGLAKAVMDLKNDRLYAVGFRRLIDHQDDLWIRTEDKTDIPFGGGRFTVRIIDEESKINVNRITPQSLNVFAYLLRQVSRMDEVESQEVARALIDYVDPDFWSQLELNTDEQTFYTEWAYEQFGEWVPEPGWRFEPKNDQLLNLEELLEVPGITHTMLFGQRDRLFADPMEEVLEPEAREPALVDFLTVTRGSRVNLNTCDPVVFGALLAAAYNDDKTIEDLVENFLDFREDRMEEETDHGIGITDVATIAEIGLTEDAVQLMGAAIPFTVFSNHFRILSQGEFEGVRETLDYTVIVGVQQYRIDPDDEITEGMRDPDAFGQLEDEDYIRVDPEVRVLRKRSY